MRLSSDTSATVSGVPHRAQDSCPCDGKQRVRMGTGRLPCRPFPPPAMPSAPTSEPPMVRPCALPVALGRVAPYGGLFSEVSAPRIPPLLTRPRLGPAGRLNRGGQLDPAVEPPRGLAVDRHRTGDRLRRKIDREQHLGDGGVIHALRIPPGPRIRTRRSPQGLRCQSPDAARPPTKTPVSWVVQNYLCL